MLCCCPLFKKRQIRSTFVFKVQKCSILHGKECISKLPRSVLSDGRHQPDVLHLAGVLFLNDPRNDSQKVVQELPIFLVCQLKPGRLRFLVEDEVDGLLDDGNILFVQHLLHPRRVLDISGLGKFSRIRCQVFCLLYDYPRFLMARSILDHLAEVQKLFVDASRQIWQLPTSFLADPGRRANRFIRTRSILGFAESCSRPPDIVPKFSWAGPVDHVTSVGGELGKVVSASVALESRHPSLAMTPSSCDVTLLVNRSVRVAIARHALHFVTLLTAGSDVVMLFATALARHSVTRLIEAMSSVTVTRPAYWAAPPVARAHFFLHGVAVLAHMTGLLLAPTDVIAVASEGTNAVGRAEVKLARILQAIFLFEGANTTFA